jgi:hypothetical protein
MPIPLNSLVHRLHGPPDIPYSELVQRVRQFPTNEFLRYCNRLSMKLDETPLEKSLVAVPVMSKYRVMPRSAIYATPWALAFLAKTSILHSHNGMHGTVTPADFIGLSYMYEMLLGEEGISDIDASFSHMIRMKWQQHGYQTYFPRVFARAILLFREAHKLLINPEVDLPEIFEKLTGLSLTKYMAIGFCYFSGAIDDSASTIKRAFASTGIMANLISEEECELFLARNSATYEEFRTLSAHYRVDDETYIKTEMNVLLQRPLIATDRRDLVAPVPNVVAKRVTEGLLHDVWDSLGQADRMAYSRYFGLLFEEYVGILLRHAFGSNHVFHEPSYRRGKQAQEGPDWIVIDNRTALLFECRSSRLNLQTRIFGDIDAVRKDIERMFIKTIEAFPAKVNDLKDGITGVDITGVESFRQIVVLYDPIGFEGVYREIADRILNERGKPLSDYVLLDIEALEALTGFNNLYPLVDFLSDLQETQKEATVDAGDFVRIKAGEKGLSFRHELMEKVVDDFLLESLGLTADEFEAAAQLKR